MSFPSPLSGKAASLLIRVRFFTSEFDSVSISSFGPPVVRNPPTIIIMPSFTFATASTRVMCLSIYCVII